MKFEIGKQYIVDVTNNGIICIEEFNSERFFYKEHDDLIFLTDEEKDTIINNILDKIRAEIRNKMKFNSFNEGYVLYDDITQVLDKYKADKEQEDGTNQQT